MRYTCILCGYSTNKTSNFNKHNKSKRHLRKDKMVVRNLNQKPTINNKYNADLNAQLIKEKDEANKILKKAMADKDKVLDDKDKQIEKLTKNNDELKKIVSVKINEISNNSKRTNRLLFSLLESCTIAPPFRPIEDKTKLRIGYESINKFAKDMIIKYKRKILVQFIGDFIVNHYKRKDPRYQSIFNCDTSRYNYKYLYYKERSQWLNDKGGVMVEYTAIDPLLNEIRRAIKKKYTYDYLVKISKLTNPDLLYDTEMWNHSLHLKREISEGKISRQVLRYISPHLHLTREQELMIERLDHSRLIMME